MKLRFFKPWWRIVISQLRDHRNRLQFGVGDKICCTRNAYLSELLPQNTSHSQEGNDREASGEDFNATPHGFAKNKHDFESDIRLCNGEIFFITQVSDDRKIIPFYLIEIVFFFFLIGQGLSQNLIISELIFCNFFLRIFAFMFIRDTGI